MKFKSIVLLLTTQFFSSHINAKILSIDWQSANDNLITRDTRTGLEWLDISVTQGLYLNEEVIPGLAAGQVFDGWRYATENELSEFFDSFGGNSNFYDGLSTENNGLFDRLAPYWNDAWCLNIGCETGDGWTSVIIADLAPDGSPWVAAIVDDINTDIFLSSDYVNLRNYSLDGWLDGELATGSALVRDISSVPVPATFWLFGSGIIGLLSLSRRRFNQATKKGGDMPSFFCLI